METTLVLLKPDTIERSIIGQIITRLENKWLKISGMKMMKLNKEIIEEHYDFLTDKPFFPSILKYMQRTPVVAIAVSGMNSISTVRTLSGATNPEEALPGSIRWDFGLTIDGNIIHASDSEKSAKEEIERFFGWEWVFEYEKISDDVL